jgi:hypothetical protein
MVPLWGVRSYLTRYARQLGQNHDKYGENGMIAARQWQNRRESKALTPRFKAALTPC